MCEPSLRKVVKGVLKLLIGNGLVHLTRLTLTFDPQINRILLLPRMDVWTEFEEGRSRRSRVTDKDRPADRHVQSNMPSLLLLHFKGMLICEAVCIL